MRYKVWIVGVAAVMLALSAAGVAWAAEANRDGVLAGRVVEVGGASLTIETRDGTVEVWVTSETTFRVPGKTDGTLADVPVGSTVLIRTETDEDGEVKAHAVVVRFPRRLQEHVVRGTVIAVQGDEISVEMADSRTATLLIADTTRLWVPGEPPTTTVDLAVGDPVLALGKPTAAESGEKTLTAWLVVVVGDQDLPKVLIRGRAVAITQQTIVVQTGRGERAITVLPRTHIWSARGRLDSLHDIHQGEQIVALGQPTELGRWVVGAILVPGPAPLADNGSAGR